MLNIEDLEPIKRAEKKFHENDRVITCPIGPAGKGHEFKTGPMGAIDYSEPGITKEAAEEKAKYKHTCPECSVKFCYKCNSAPYHEGFTCDENKTRKEPKKCRFCDT